MKRETPNESVRKRPLGATGLNVTELALGTWGLSGDGYGPVTDADVEATIERAVELGIELFDTSDAYGRGAMEARLGRSLEPYREKTRIVTRHGIDRSSEPPRRRYDPAYLRTTIDASKQRLRRDAIDVFLLHNPPVDVLVRGQTLAFLNELREKKEIVTWGVSAGDTEVARVALQVNVPVLSFAYNITIGSDLHSLAGDIAKQKTGLLVHSVLAYGLLAGTWHEKKTFREGDHRRDRWTPRQLAARLEQLDAPRSLVGGDVLSTRAASIRWVLANQLVSSAILGPRNVAQLEQLVREAGKGPPYLDEEKLAKLPQKLAQAGIDP